MPVASAAMEGAAEELDEDMPTMIRERHKGFIQPTPMMGLATIEAPLSLRPGSVPGQTESTAESGDDALEPGRSTSKGPGRRAAREVDGVLDEPDELVAGDADVVDEEIVSESEIEPLDEPPRLSTPPPLPFADLSADPIELSGSELEVLSSASNPATPLPHAGQPPVMPPVTPPVVDDDDAESGDSMPSLRRQHASGLPMTISDVGVDGEPVAAASSTWDSIARLDSDRSVASAGSESEVAPLPSLASHHPLPLSEPLDRPDKGGGSMSIRLLIGILLVVIVGASGYVVYDRYLRGDDESSQQGERNPTTIADAGARAPASQDASPTRQVESSDAGASDPIDAGTTVVEAAPDAAPTMPATDTPVQTPTDDGRLTIKSDPRRGKVYLDGSPIGNTTVRIDATKDRHRLVVIRPGYKLYTAEIDGSGNVEVKLEEADSLDGPAGIKVRCSRKNRYYVFVDGQHTGQLCPTERLGVAVGEHMVEIYDPVTETRRQFPIRVEDTRHSVRVRVD